MNILNFFTQTKKIQDVTSTTKEASTEQILFAENALEIVSPQIESFGFERTKIKIENTVLNPLDAIIKKRQFRVFFVQ